MAKPWPVRRGFVNAIIGAILALAVSLVSAGAEPAEATHFRYGGYSWRPVGGTTIEFSIQNSFRRVGYTCISPVTLSDVPCAAPDGYPGIGDVVPEFVGFTQFDPGDGTIIGSPVGPLLYLVTSIDLVNDWFFGLALNPDTLPLVNTAVTHTYAANGDYLANTDSCCRISQVDDPNAHINNPDGGYRVETMVNVGTQGGNASPVSTMPPIVACPVSGACAFPVTAVDPNGDALRFRLATPSEASSSPPSSACPTLFCQPGPPFAPSAAAINPATGVYTWNTTGADTAASLGAPTLNTLYSTQVVVEDLGSSGNVKSKISIDFLIQLGAFAVGSGPRFDVPPTPPCGSTLTVSAGGALSFTVQASDPDAGDIVTLNGVGLPLGATMTPPLPTSGNPVSSIFRWTTTLADTGPHVVTFTASDKSGQQALCPLVISVSAGGPPPPPISQEGRMTGGGSFFTATGMRVTHGFALECDLLAPPHNLQVNWGRGNKFHLQIQTSALCSDDPTISPGQPPAAFDTYQGTGTGRYNGQAGATARWKFTDAGEPGNHDYAEMTIMDANGNVVLVASSYLNSGNHQAH